MKLNFYLLIGLILFPVVVFAQNLPEIKGTYHFSTDFTPAAVKEEIFLTVGSSSRIHRLQELRNLGYVCEVRPRQLYVCAKFIKDFILPQTWINQFQDFAQNSEIEFFSPQGTWSLVNESYSIRQFTRKQKVIFFEKNSGTTEASTVDFYELTGLAKIKFEDKWINIIDGKMSYRKGPYSIHENNSKEMKKTTFWVDFPLE